ncbi:AraC family transcriptional regulator [Maribacter arcticus]|jgi:AraC-like DNA-binding protein|uniref:AraC-type DNA-binding protein n=1 Tax=Maribacter arcticus TaxID=561365 RepID=A0A1T4ZT50_9FLAO|nr:AraC family transcriptional regulator [Maribacter arcticus]SKB25920.1 AraC-type DNA-binding protein [Maribacter arcticus]|tara:strand:+ start:1961 stop:2845 length:885 start_codon:yes stop_codon:yes gene_type:complete
MNVPNIEKTLNPDELFLFKDLISPHFNPNWHFHPELQISFIVRGKGTRFIADHVETFEEEDLVLTGPNVPHLWRNDEAYFNQNNNLSTRGLVIYFNSELLHSALLQKNEFYHINKLIKNSARGIEFYGETKKEIKGLLLKMEKVKGFKGILILLEIIDVLANSKNYSLLASPAYTNVLKADDTNKMSLVYEYVMTNFKSKIALEDISNMLNMTTTSFCKYFKPRANKTFTRFVNEIRIGHARKLLLQDNLNISEIGYECGFSTLSNFNKQFKSIANMPPHEYRKLFLKIKTPIS